MFQNKIYQNFFIEILKTFFVVLFGLSIIALTVRAVSFLDLIVDSGYPVSTYFKYSFLNLFGILPKFIPLSFLIATMIFMLKHLQDNEFVILWTSGVKKIKIVNLVLSASILILILYLILSIFLTPMALNKSRQLLSSDQINSFLPTIKRQQFSDSFKGFTFLVEKKINNEIKNIFLNDKNNNLKNLSANISKDINTTIIAENGVVDQKKLILFNGMIISSGKNNLDNKVVKFDQLNVDLNELDTATIKQPKLQETSTIELFACFVEIPFNISLCREEAKKEMISTLNRRIIVPFYIPIISLLSSLLLVKSKKFYLNKFSIFSYSFILLIFIELAVRYTGISNLIKLSFMTLPIILIFIIYLYLIYKFSKEAKYE
tara:strand:- start:23633 stop:24757 length:1125 start_codon:yes stop_codon:yes gene_type:complete